MDILPHGVVAESADALASGASELTTREGSTPSSPTRLCPCIQRDLVYGKPSTMNCSEA